jgi:saccharopine dehydrogenase (NAD+, L-lysine forming)
MIKIALVREGKFPADNRVALIPSQCRWLQRNFPDLKIVVQSSGHRCFPDKEYMLSGTEVREDISDCDFMLGIKEVPVADLIAGKTYLFFSHTKKRQIYNQALFHAILDRQITLIDYECLEHEDGQRILGFGFFAGVVGAHNGIMAYGKRTGLYSLERVHAQQSFRNLIHTYFGLKLPNIKVTITGSGRVAHGLLEIMNLLGIIEMEPDEFLNRKFTYPVFTQLKGADLYERLDGPTYNREDFHRHPGQYRCKFYPYTKSTDILMNGIYWEKTMPRLFEWEHMMEPGFRIQTIADITDDKEGSIPCNLGDSVMERPIYGVDPKTRKKTDPYRPGAIDLMAVGNLPNELPRDASRYFGEQLIKYVLEDLLKEGSSVIERATMVKKGRITDHYEYLKEYGGQR